MLKTIKRTKQMRLDELIKYVWENSISDKEFKSETNPHIIVYVTQDNNVLDNGYSIGENDLFPVEIEEEITEDKVFDKYVVLLKGGIISTPFRAPVKAVMGGYYTNIESVYALIDGKLELIWEADND